MFDLLTLDPMEKPWPSRTPGLLQHPQGADRSRSSPDPHTRPRRLVAAAGSQDLPLPPSAAGASGSQPPQSYEGRKLDHAQARNDLVAQVGIMRMPCVGQVTWKDVSDG